MIISKEQAIKRLQSGEVVALPTETVYGLAAAVHNKQALESIFKIKNRPFFDPLIIHIYSSEQVEDLVTDWSEAARLLCETFWPGPFTLVLNKSDKVSSLITAGKETVALRMPDHAITLDIIQSTGPLAAPSANLFGKTSPSQVDHVLEAFDSKVPVVDGGPCKIGIESTIIRLDEESPTEIKICILRPGHISRQKIRECLAQTNKNITFIKHSEDDMAPGTLDHHYQPNFPLILGTHQVKWSQDVHKKICQKLNLESTAIPALWKFKQDDPSLVARHLYQEMREKNQQGTYTYLQLPEDFQDPKWDAIRDRTKKASSFKVTNLHGELAILDKNQY